MILNLAVLCLVGTVLWRQIHWRRPMIIVLMLLLVTTAIFDSLIVAQQIVAYDPAKILGISIGRAPIEDFAYAIASALMIPALWNKLRSDT